VSAVEERIVMAGRAGLPVAGPLSELIAGVLCTAPLGDGELRPEEVEAGVGPLIDEVADPLADDDLQLALYLCYELRYRSLSKADQDWGWRPTLLATRALLELSFFCALEEELPRWEPVDPATVGDALFRLEANDERVSLSRHLEIEAGLDEFREFVVHRLSCRLKEADPRRWTIPRLAGAAKTALLEVQGDECHSTRPEHVHSLPFARAMRALGLDDRENAYLGLVPGATLATANLMSGLGLHRSRRGAVVGHLAMFEMTSAQPNRRYGNALRRLGFGPEATDFFDERVEADAVPENPAAYDLAVGLARQEPELADDILFGARALLHLEDRLARRLLAAWSEGETSLRRAL
jgi:hypothetical protein